RCRRIAVPGAERGTKVLAGSCGDGTRLRRRRMVSYRRPGPDQLRRIRASAGRAHELISYRTAIRHLRKTWWDRFRCARADSYSVSDESPESPARGAVMSDEVLLERRDRVLIVTINRPQARNAVNAAVSH